MAAIVQSAASSYVASNSASFTVTLGSSPTVGNTLLAFYGGLPGTATGASPPSGFSVIKNTTQANTGGVNQVQVGVASRVVQSGDGTTYTFTGPGGASVYGIGAVVYEISGANFIGFNVAQGNASSVGGGAVTIGSYSSNDLTFAVAAAFTNFSASNGWTQPSPATSGLVQDYNLSSASVYGALGAWHISTALKSVTSNANDPPVNTANYNWIDLVVNVSTTSLQDFPTPPPPQANNLPPIGPPPVAAWIVGQTPTVPEIGLTSFSGPVSTTFVASASALLSTKTGAPPPIGPQANNLPRIGPPPVAAQIVGQVPAYDYTPQSAYAGTGTLAGTFAGTATATLAEPGTGTLAGTFAGTATPVLQLPATGTAAFGFAGTSSAGLATTGSAAFALSATATATLTQAATATGSASFIATATATLQFPATATGAYGFAGTASGTAVESETGALNGAFTAVSTPVLVEPSSGALFASFTATASGALAELATGVVGATFVATATASITFPATATASDTFTASSTAKVILPATGSFSGTFSGSSAAAYSDTGAASFAFVATSSAIYFIPTIAFVTITSAPAYSALISSANVYSVTITSAEATTTITSRPVYNATITSKAVTSAEITNL